MSITIYTYNIMMYTNLCCVLRVIFGPHSQRIIKMPSQRLLTEFSRRIHRRLSFLFLFLLLLFLHNPAAAQHAWLIAENAPNVNIVTTGHATGV